MEKVEITNAELKALANSIAGLSNLSSENKDGSKTPVSFGVKFNFCLAVNKRKIRDEIEGVSEAEETLLKDYTAALKASANEDGLVKNKDVEALQSEFKEVLDKHKEYLKTKTEIMVHKVLQTDVPDIPLAYYDGIFPLIETEKETLGAAPDKK